MRKTSLRLGLYLVLLAVALGTTRCARSSAKVILISLDGAADHRVDDYLERGVLPASGALAQLARAGARADYMAPPESSMTATAHITMFTGAFPERHGVVSNTYHTAGDAITRPTRGLSSPSQAETLWQAARRQGKRVACVAAVGADGSTPERSCDLTLGYGWRVGRSAVVVLRPGAKDESAGGEEFEHARRLLATNDTPGQPAFNFDRTEDIPVRVFAADGLFDGQERYDTLLLDLDDDTGNGFAACLREGEWAPVRLEPDGSGPAGSWVKALELAQDLTRLRLYLGAAHTSRGAPADFMATVEAELGFWPGGPDDWNLDRGLVDERTWQEQAERLSDYLRDATLLTMQHGDWDLLITYQPLVDEVQHRFLLQDPRQPGYDDEGGNLRARYADYVEWGYQRVDRVLLALREAAPAETNLVVVSDHGAAPAHTRVLLNTALARAGLRVTDDESSEVRAFASGSTGHIRVDLAGREPTGVVPADQLDEYVERIVAACRALRDPVSGDPVFERVLRRAELDELQLGHPETAGDVWVNARPGYALSGRVLTEPAGAGADSTNAVFEPAATLRAQHGHLSHNREVQAIFYAAGPAVQPGKLGTVRAVDVAPTVSALLGMEAPAQSEGKNVLRAPD